MRGQAAFELIETSALSVWLREDLFAFPGVLIVHTLGMAMAAGVAAAVSLRLLGLARSVPLSALRPFMPFAWFGFVINALSGVLLVISYPAKALTNPVFYAKLVLIGVSAALLARMTQGLRGEPSSGGEIRSARALAIASLAAWMLTITAGRLLPYTYRYLLSSEALSSAGLF